MNDKTMFDCAKREIDNGRFNLIRGGQQVGICVTGDGLAATINTRYESGMITNYQNLGHYPMSAVMEIYNE